jgi:hypothetical protein
MRIDELINIRCVAFGSALSRGTSTFRLSLWPLPRTVSASTRSMVLRIFCLHFVGTAGMFAAQYYTGRWLFSWDNYYSQENGWDYITYVGMDAMQGVKMA